MKEPKKFPGVLSGVMLVVAILFGGAGAVGYMAYGSDIQTVVLVNLPQDDKFVQAVQFLCTSATYAPSAKLTSRLDCDPPLHPTPVVPSSEDHGEWPIRPFGKEQPQGQMAEKPLPGCDRLILLSTILGLFIRAR
jgi:hypothetical protein